MLNEHELEKLNSLQLEYIVELVRLKIITFDQIADRFTSDTVIQYAAERYLAEFNDHAVNSKDIIKHFEEIHNSVYFVSKVLNQMSKGQLKLLKEELSPEVFK